MDVYQRKIWLQHYKPELTASAILDDDSLRDYFRFTIRPMSRVLEQAIMRGALLEPLHSEAAHSELCMMFMMFVTECVSDRWRLRVALTGCVG